ncbi:MAG: response regulator transcription factor [Phototrophicaceae bacterium]
MFTTILIVNPDRYVHQQLKAHHIDDLIIEWVCAFTAQHALAILEEKHVDVVLTDLNLPDMSGFSFIHQVKYSASVVVYTNNHDEQLMLRAFDEGADDFIIQTRVNIAEVFLRLNAIVKRKIQSHMSFKNIQLDLHSKRAWWKGTELQVSSKRFAFLLELVKYPNTIRSKDQLLTAVSSVDYRMLYVIAYDIRQQIERDSSNPIYLLNVRGVGYLLKV